MGKPVKESFLNIYLDYIQESEELDEQLIKKSSQIALPLAAAEEPDDVDKELEEQGGFLPTFAKGLAMAAPGLAVGQLTGNPMLGIGASIATGSAMQAYQQSKAKKERENQMQAAKAAQRARLAGGA
jgi:hypothetical protein